MPDTFNMPRRDFMLSLMAIPLVVSTINAHPQQTPSSPVRLESFEYSGVRLLPSRLRDQYLATRDFYFALPNDDLVYGFRKHAGLPAPGKSLDGWCSNNTDIVFGQWLSGMARMAKANDDTGMRDKAVRLMNAWEHTIKFSGNAGISDSGPNGHYSYDKMVCGLTDLYLYTGNSDAVRLLKKITENARQNLGRTRSLASPNDPQAGAGKCLEWYTLSENLYRAYLATGDPIYREFGDVWRYEAYWSMFLESSAPPPLRVHAYSHINSFSSAALSYHVSGDRRYLRIIRNAYEYIRHSQMFAAGGYGPGERLVGYAGELGRSLELHADTAEIPCGTWSGFKLSRYLITYTGEARYGDWIERLIYNGIGAALPMGEGGNTFYYADYRTGSGTKYYLWDHWPCCSGTYLQDVADYHNIIYFHDDSGLYVNLFIPSEVTWQQSGQTMRLTQQTKYPESEDIQLTIETDRQVSTAIRFRVPDWATSVSVMVNGTALPVDIRPSTWATIRRIWQKGDRIDIRIPMRLRAEPIDEQHPERVAILYGPVVLVEDLRFNLGLQMQAGHHSSEDLAARLRQGENPLHFDVIDPPDQVIRSGRFYPYYAAQRDIPYRMYHDFAQNELPGFKN
jgi:hypothetical protein